MYDVIIKNGNIIDGSGSPGFEADLAVKGDKIVKIGELHEEKAEVEIDAFGKTVCPGFVDVNNHSDTFWQLFLNPDLESLVYQGITTIVGGTCGSSLAPLATPETIASIQKWVDLSRINLNWLTFEEYLNFLSSKKIALNYATLVGHATLRRGILKDDPRNPNPKELKFMKKMLRLSLKDGALGLSSGLVYSHAHQARSDEIIELAKIAADYQGVYVTHIRDEGIGIAESVEEALRIASISGAKSHISHLKVMGSRNWHKMEEVLEILDQGKRNGLDVSFDVYPYTSTGSVLYALLPAWVSEGGRKMMLSRLKDQAIRSRVIAEMKDSEFEYGKVEISSSSLDKTLTRKMISEIAVSQGKSEEEAVIDILLASEGRVITSMEVLSEENVKMAIVHPLSMIASNGAGYKIEHSRTGSQVHPRSFGTFTRVLAEYVFSQKIITLEEAVRKMTSFPAKKFGLEKRGLLEKGHYADILVFENNKISSPSTRENPYQYSRGIENVFLNGKMILDKGKYLGERNGRVLKR